MLCTFCVLPNRLKPFTSYQFKVKATNDIGDSEYSEQSEAITTLQDGNIVVHISNSNTPTVDITKMFFVPEIFP
jgi:hypothetical protein